MSNFIMSFVIYSMVEFLACLNLILFFLICTKTRLERNTTTNGFNFERGFILEKDYFRTDKLVRRPGNYFYEPISDTERLFIVLDLFSGKKHECR